jgi:hypothetical protein
MSIAFLARSNSSSEAALEETSDGLRFYKGTSLSFCFFGLTPEWAIDQSWTSSKREILRKREDQSGKDFSSNLRV